MALTAENTRALNAVSEMTAAQRGLEAGLTKTRKTMFVDPVLQRRQVRTAGYCSYWVTFKAMPTNSHIL